LGTVREGVALLSKGGNNLQQGGESLGPSDKPRKAAGTQKARIAYAPFHSGALARKNRVSREAAVLNVWTGRLYSPSEIPFP